MGDSISRQAAISEKKMQIVINNYFKSECNVDTSIRQAFEKGFRIGIKKGLSVQPERKRGKWIERNPQNSPDCRLIECSECGNTYIVGYSIDYDDWIGGRNFCMKCGADLRGGGNGKST